MLFANYDLNHFRNIGITKLRPDNAIKYLAPNKRKYRYVKDHMFVDYNEKVLHVGNQSIIHQSYAIRRM